MAFQRHGIEGGTVWMRGSAARFAALLVIPN